MSHRTEVMVNLQEGHRRAARLQLRPTEAAVPAPPEFGGECRTSRAADARTPRLPLLTLAQFRTGVDRRLWRPNLPGGYSRARDGKLQPPAAGFRIGVDRCRSTGNVSAVFACPA